MSTSLLPPNVSPMERALEAAGMRLSEIPGDLGSIWNPATCPAPFLPWLAWALSIDFWDADWPEAQKRQEIADTIVQQRRKGTRASMQTMLARFDPLIELTEWFEDAENLGPNEFRVELPRADASSVDYTEATVTALLRDIAAVKPLREHPSVFSKVCARAPIGATAGIRSAVSRRESFPADRDTAGDPVWANYLQTEDGEPLQSEDGQFLEAA